MAQPNELNVCEKLLLAAWKIELAGRCPFTAEDLVISAWKEFPETFGLRGHNDGMGKPLYPDSNRVFAEIMGTKPIRKQGLLVKVGTKIYELTELGREVAKGFMSSKDDLVSSKEKSGKASLSREVQQELERLIASKALQKVDKGELEAVTFHDACIFWGITPRSTAIELKGRLANIDGLVDKAKSIFQHGPAGFRHGGKKLSADILDLISRVQKELQIKFGREIETIQKRSDERKN